MMNPEPNPLDDVPCTPCCLRQFEVAPLVNKSIQCRWKSPSKGTLFRPTEVATNQKPSYTISDRKWSKELGLLTYTDRSHNPLPHNRPRGTRTGHVERIYAHPSHCSSSDDTARQTVLVFCLCRQRLETSGLRGQLANISIGLQSRLRRGHSGVKTSSRWW